jgi:26S proteasome regulatory subunit T6
MALDTFFHNKIESMKLEIIQGQAVLRRLEAQRNDYNSRGQLRRVSYPLSRANISQCDFYGKSLDYYSNLDHMLARW